MSFNMTSPLPVGSHDSLCNTDSSDVERMLHGLIKYIGDASNMARYARDAAFAEMNNPHFPVFSSGVLSCLENNPDATEVTSDVIRQCLSYHSGVLVDLLGCFRGYATGLQGIHNQQVRYTMEHVQAAVSRLVVIMESIYRTCGGVKVTPSNTGCDIPHFTEMLDLAARCNVLSRYTQVLAMAKDDFDSLYNRILS